MKNKHEINQAVIRYIGSCALEGRSFELSEMGIGPDECKEIMGISLHTLLELERKMDGHILKIELNRPLFERLMDNIRQEEQTAHIRASLYTADAPADMMATLYGIGQKEYARQRRALRLPSSVGRPPELDPIDIERLHQVFSQFECAIAPEQWLELAEETGHSLRMLWRAYQCYVPNDTPELIEATQ